MYLEQGNMTSFIRLDKNIWDIYWSRLDDKYIAYTRGKFSGRVSHRRGALFAHWDWNKMAAILYTSFSKAFSRMKIVIIFWFKFQGNFNKITDDIFYCISLNENIQIYVKISLECIWQKVHVGSANNLALNRWQVITQTKGDQDQCHDTALSDHSKLGYIYRDLILVHGFCIASLAFLHFRSSMCWNSQPFFCCLRGSKTCALLCWVIATHFKYDLHLHLPQTTSFTFTAAGDLFFVLRGGHSWLPLTCLIISAHLHFTTPDVLSSHVLTAALL